MSQRSELCEGVSGDDDAVRLEAKIVEQMRRAHLTRDSNAFFLAAKEVQSLDGESALLIAERWRDMTKTFMLTTIAGLGVMACEADSQTMPRRSLLEAMQTGFGVIGDDLCNVMPVFRRAAPPGADGVHYVWWEKTIVRPLRERLPATRNRAAAHPAGVARLIENMRRLASHPLGAAV